MESNALDALAAKTFFSFAASTFDCMRANKYDAERSIKRKIARLTTKSMENNWLRLAPRRQSPRFFVRLIKTNFYQSSGFHENDTSPPSFRTLFSPGPGVPLTCADTSGALHE